MPDRTNATSSTAGILRPDEFDAHAHVERLPCAAALSPWVENHWLLQWDLPPGTTYLSSVLPHPACNVTIEHGTARPGVGADRVVVTGLVSTRFDVPVVGRGWVLGAKFRPGGLAAFGRLDAGALADRVVPAVDVLPAAVCDGLRTIAAGTPAGAAVQAADRALAAGIPPDPDPAYDTVLRLIDDMLGDRTLVRVAQIEERHAIGRRQVERLFARYVGIGPKWVLARYRMHDVVTTLDSGCGGSLADLAARYGWYDQAHFSRDFTRHIGVPPGEYRARAELAKRPPPPSPALG